MPDVDVRELFRSLISRSTLDGPPVYRVDILYQPSFFFSPVDNSGVNLRATTPKELETAPELNPTHLSPDQSVESRIDGTTRNVVYHLPGGDVRIGFYNRNDVEKANAASSHDLGELLHLIDGTDTYCPKLDIIERQDTSATLLGENFPQMFGLRSVVFQEDTRYGVVVAVDRSLVGGPEEFTRVLLDKEFITQHPHDMNYLFPLIIESAKQEGLDVDHNLLLSDSIQQGDKLTYILAVNDRYSATVSYRRTPVISVVGRLNAIPICLSAKVKDRHFVAAEISYGGMEIGDCHLTLLKQATIQDPEHPDQSYSGDIWYKLISRTESAGLAKGDPSFGLFEIQVAKCYQIDDFQIEFNLVEKAKELPLSFERGFKDELVLTRSLGAFEPKGIRYTAGLSEVRALRQTTINTTSIGFERVLLRDAFCLVHREQGDMPPDYG